MTQVQIDAVRKLNEASVKQLRNKRDFIVPFLRTTLSSFSEQSEEFATAVIAENKSLEGCVNALKVPEGDRVSLSDFDVYRMAVQYFLDGADVEWSMRVQVPKSQSIGKARVLELSLEDFLFGGGK